MRGARAAGRTGTVETAALGDGLRSLSRRSSTPSRGLPDAVDPLLTPPTAVEPLLGARRFTSAASHACKHVPCRGGSDA